MKHKAAAMRFSGGKDSVLAALRVGSGLERLDMLTFSTRMITDLAASRLSADRVASILAPRTQVNHHFVDIDPVFRLFYQPRGWWADWGRYGTYASCCICNSCELAMIACTVLHCVRNGVHLAFDGANRGEFVGLTDDWGLAEIRAFSAEFGVQWEFPVYDEQRADLAMLEVALNADPPQLLYRGQPRCIGAGVATNMYMRCYFLPRYGPEGYKRMTLLWLEERLQLARRFIEAHRYSG